MWFLEEITHNSAFALSALAVALAGGWHCAGMCGGLAALASKPANVFWAQLGRLISYVSLGVISGAFGSRVLEAVPLSWRWPASIAMAALSFWVLISTWNLSLPLRIQRFFWSHRPKQLPALDFLTLGMLNGFLPCHWLYGFLVSAAALGSPFKGGVLLMALWAGSVPWLLGASSLGHWVRRRGLVSPWISRGWLVLVLASLLAQTFAQNHSHAHHHEAPSKEAVICNGE